MRRQCFGAETRFNRYASKEAQPNSQLIRHPLRETGLFLFADGSQGRRFTVWHLPVIASDGTVCCFLPAALWFNVSVKPENIDERKLSRCTKVPSQKLTRGNEELGYFTGLFFILFVSFRAKIFVYPLKM